MDGSFAIAETYIRIEDAVPTPQTLDRRATQLEAYARSVGLEVFGHGLSFEVEVEPGSIIERCKVYAPIVAIAAGIVTMASQTVGLLDRDYSPDGQIRRNVDQLYQASKAFSDQIISKVVPDRPASPQKDDTDRSAVKPRRYTLTLGKLKRALDVAQDLEVDPRSTKLLMEFQRRVSLLLADCDSEEERAQLIKVLEQDEPARTALVRGFGKSYAGLAQSPPDASHYVLRYYGKGPASAPPERKRLTAAERRALPKPVVRRFSI